MANRNPNPIPAGSSALNTGSTKTIDTLGGVYLTLATIWSAGVSAGTVVLEGSPDGTNWTTTALITRGFAASTTFADSITSAHRYVRARISVALVGGTVAGYVTIAGPMTGSWWGTE